jgi:GR25 family glycosyltransferase involved in LPS biosynthesis
MLINNIWVINLDKSKDRLSHINNEFNKFNIKFKRFSAIYGKELSNKELIKETTLLSRNITCSYGMIGCALSHKYLWKQLLSDKNTNYYIIIEDDVIIKDKFKNFIIDLDKIKDKIDFDVISLSCRNIGCSIIKNEFSINNIHIGKCLIPLSTGGYIISKKGAFNLLKILPTINYHIDTEIAFKNYFYDFNYYVTSECLINFVDGDSTLSLKNNSLTNKFLKYLNLDFYCWLINEPILVFNLEYTFTILVFLLLLILFFNIIYFESFFITLFIIFELLLIYILI